MKRGRLAPQLALPMAVTPDQEVGRYRPILIGGWRGYSGWVDPREVPLCHHDHSPVENWLMARLVRKCLVTSLFSRRCLLAEWREFPAGTEVLLYGRMEWEKFDLFVTVSEEVNDGID